MKHPVLLFTLLLSGSAAHAQYGGLATEAVGLGLNMLKNAAQKPTEFVTTTSYGQQQLKQKRTPAAQVPAKGAAQIMAVEQQLAACYQLLQASSTASLLTGNHSAEAITTALSELARVRPNWNRDAYGQELEFYRQQELVRQQRRDAQVMHLRDSTQLAAEQRVLQPDRQVRATPSLAYVNSTGEVLLLTQPYALGKCIGYVTFGTPVSVFYNAHQHHYVSVNGVYGWIDRGKLAPSIQTADQIGASAQKAIEARPPGYVGLELSQKPALVALTPAEYAADSTARAKVTAKELAYGEAHPPRERPVKNNTVYVDLDEKPRADGMRVDVDYHLSRDCYFVPSNAKLVRLAYSEFGRLPSYINLLRCAECGYDYPKPYAEFIKAASTKPAHTAKAAPAKLLRKPAPHK